MLGWAALRLFLERYLSPQDASHLTALAFGIVSSFVSGVALCWGAFPFVEQTWILHISISYYITDLVWLISKPKWMFILHHVLTLIIFIILLSHPPDPLFYLMFFLAEITNPLQQGFNLLRRYAKDTGTRGQFWFRFISTAYTFLYVSVRGVLWPYLCLTLPLAEVYGSASGLWLRCLFILIIMGSYVWASRLIRGWNKHTFAH